MKHLPHKVKMFVKNCDVTAHQYNQGTLIGASDSILGYHGRHFTNILDFLDSSNPRVGRLDILSTKNARCVCDQPITNNDYNFSKDGAKAVGTKPSSDCHQHATGWGRGSPPNFFSHPNGTVVCVLSCNNTQTILELSPLIELSKEFTNDAQEQALPEGPKVGVFLRSLLKLFAYCEELEYVPTNLLDAPSRSR